jgi:hypothetical protein
MNVICQILFWSPANSGIEFTDGKYHSIKIKTIAHQIQRLFKLQNGNNLAISITTKDLTTSFVWTIA